MTVSADRPVVSGEVEAPRADIQAHERSDYVIGSDRAMVTTKPEESDIFATDELVPVPLPGTPFTVMLQRELNWGEQAELEAAALRGLERKDIEAAASGTSTIVLDISKQRMMSLALRVRKWNVTRMNPTTQAREPVRLPTHLSERIAVMRALKPRWARALLAKIEELDKLNGEGEPDMPQSLIPPDEDKNAGPKAMSNGATDEQIETPISASSWDGATTS